MRKLKFRVYNGIEMVYDIVVGKFGAFYVNPGDKGNGLNPNDSACLTNFNTKYSDDTSIMQFIGISDKNGKEIYEGDIIKYNDINYSIDFCNCYSCGKYELIRDKKENGSHLSSECENWHQTEVIGNIYENPELLK